MAEFAPNANSKEARALQEQLAGSGGAYTSRSRCEKTSLSRYLESRGGAVTSIGSSKESMIPHCNEVSRLIINFKVL